MLINKKDTIHIIGIGGIGMSGIAEIMSEMGFRVQGSDVSRNNNIDRLTRKKIKVFSDYCISPLHIDILIKKINNLIVKRKSGISHFHGGYPDISYYDFAVSVANELQCSQELIQKTSYKDANFIYKLPRFTSLSED